jgi:hypothetical protein
MENYGSSLVVPHFLVVLMLAEVRRGRFRVGVATS